MPDAADEMPAGVTMPIQPTGYGVADLEIACEQDALAGGGGIAGALDNGPAGADSVEASSPTVGGAAADDSEAHPS